MRVSSRRKNKFDVDLSPMLDVIFQLILFFLVSTTFAVLPGISVNLPESSTSEATSAEGVTITVSENESLYFNDELISLKDLNQTLLSIDTKEIKKEEFPITISADENVKNGFIVKIFDELRKAGFVSVSLRTKE